MSWVRSLIALGGFMVASCSNPQPGSAGVTEVSPAETAKLVADGALLVDVRTDKEWNEGHLVGAAHIPIDDFQTRLAELGADKGRKIVFYCRSGGRAGRAAEFAQQSGYAAVYNAGGFVDLKDVLPNEARP